MSYNAVALALLYALKPLMVYNAPADQVHSMYAVNSACLRLEGLAVHALHRHPVPGEYFWDSQQPDVPSTRACHKHWLRNSHLWLYCTCTDHSQSCPLSKPTSKAVFFPWVMTAHTQPVWGYWPGIGQALCSIFNRNTSTASTLLQHLSTLQAIQMHLKQLQYGYSVFKKHDALAVKKGKNNRKKKKANMHQKKS